MPAAPASRFTPLQLIFVLLALIPLIDASVMYALDNLLEIKLSFWAEIGINAAFLALGCAPFLWYFFLRPIQRAYDSTTTRAQIIMDTAGEGIITMDARGVVLSFNRAAEAIFGFKPDEIIGQNIWLLIPAPQRAAHEGYIQAFLKGGSGKAAGGKRLMTGLRKDGTPFPLEIAVSETSIDGACMFIGIIHDVSDYKAAEKALAQSNELLERIFGNIRSMIAFMDRDFNLIRVNRAYAAANGHEPEFFSGKNHFALFPNTENEAIFRRVVETGEPYQAYAKAFTSPAQPAAGVTYWDWSLSPVKRADGRVEALLLDLVDVTQRELAKSERLSAITARKAMAAALFESQESQQALLNATTQAAMLVAPNGDILSLNQTASAHFKQTPQALTGKNLFDLWPAEVTSRRRDYLAQVTRDGAAVHFQDRCFSRIMEVAFYPVCNAAGIVERIAIYSHDVTEETRLRGIEALLHEVDERTLAGAPLADLATFICARVADLFGLALAWIGEKAQDGTVAPIAGAGPATGYQEKLREIGVRWDETATGCGTTGSAIRLGKTQILRVTDTVFDPWRESAQHHGLAAICAIPLIVRGQIYGAATLYSTSADTFNDPTLVTQLENIAARISVALETQLDQDRLRLLSVALATASNAVFITDKNGYIEWVNHAFCQLSGYTADEAIGQTPRFLKSGAYDADYYRALWQTILSGQTWRSQTTEKRKDGVFYTVRQVITPIENRAGVITHFISMHEDITEQLAAQARIEQMAHYDALTGLPNRNLFFDRLNQALARAKRTAGHSALLFLDLDRFKPVNDNYGHAVGDLLLKAVAERLLACVRESDTVARIAGDEFTVILNQIAERDSAGQVADKIVKTLSEPFLLDTHQIQIGVSIGIVIFPNDSQNEQDLVKLADAAMYEAKNQSRNTYRFHSTV